MTSTETLKFKKQVADTLTGLPGRHHIDLLVYIAIVCWSSSDQTPGIFLQLDTSSAHAYIMTCAHMLYACTGQL